MGTMVFGYYGLVTMIQKPFYVREVYTLKVYFLKEE
jgi:hypothetical protein